jgi:hypothetical protein
MQDQNNNASFKSKPKKIRLISGLSEAKQIRMVEERPSDIRYIDAPTPAVQFMAALRDIRTVKMIHGSIDSLVSDYVQHKRKGESKPPYVSAVDK